MASVEACTERAKMAMVVTMVSPIMRAAAVDAVRRGWRMALRRPSWPGTPRSAAKGQPSTEDSGRATSGTSPASPRKPSTRPTAATSARPAALAERPPPEWRAATTTATPATTSTAPVARR